MVFFLEDKNKKPFDFLAEGFEKKNGGGY